MIESIKTLEELKDRKEDEGYSVYCEEDGNCYRMTNGEWVIESIDDWKETSTASNQMTLYNINKQLVSQLPEFGDTQWYAAYCIIDAWVDLYKDKEYFLLYGKELSYFTLFHKEKDSDNKTLFDIVKEILVEDFIVKAVDKTSDESAIEIWVELNGETSCMYLFPYDEGVVTYGK